MSQQKFERSEKGDFYRYTKANNDGICACGCNTKILAGTEVVYVEQENNHYYFSDYTHYATTSGVPEDDEPYCKAHPD